MNENFENNELFQQLPEETKEKIRNCKTEEEAMDILKEDMIPIPDDALGDVAGGGLTGWSDCGNHYKNQKCKRCIMLGA